MIALLLDRFGGPAEPDLDIVEFFKPCAQDVFSLILRQTLVVLEIIRIDDLAQRRRRPIFIVQIAVSDDPAHGVIGRQDACGAQRVHNAPEIGVLDRTLCEILPLRNALRFAPALDERAGNTALAELDCERHADRSAADDDDLKSLGHYCRSSKIGSADSGTRCQVLGSVSSNCQLCPRADSSTSSPWSMRQAFGLNRVTRASQPGFNRSAMSPAGPFAKVNAQIGLPAPRAIAQSPSMSSAE